MPPKTKGKNTLTKKVKKLVTTINRMAPEEKQFVNDLSFYPLDDAGFILNLFQDSGATTFITQGTSETDRIGDTIKPKKTSIRYNVYMPVGMTADSTNTVRVMLIRDKCTLGAFPVIFNDILNTGALAPGSEVIAHPEYYNRNRYKIIYDKTHTLSYNGTANVFGRIRKKLTGETTYAASTGAVTDLRNNQYWLIAFSDSTTSAHPFWSHSMETLFTD